VGDNEDVSDMRLSLAALRKAIKYRLNMNQINALGGVYIVASDMMGFSLKQSLSARAYRDRVLVWRYGSG